MKKNIFIVILILTTLHTNAQLAMGKWRTHFAYNAINLIAQTENKVFALSEGSLFSIDKEDESMEFYSKMNGLNDGNVSYIEYDKLSKQLIVIYKNGNIDLLGSAGVINIPDFYNKQMSVNKAVNHISFSEGKAYMSCNFGILVLNTKKNEIADTYYIGPNGSDTKILSTAILGTQLYALTESSIYKANANEPNLVNYEYWSTMQSLPGTGDLKRLSYFAGKLILLRGAQLYSYTENEGWQNILSSIYVQDVNFSNEKMIIYSSDLTLYLVNQNFETTLIENIGEVLDAEYDEQSNKYWLAANAKGVLAIGDQSNAQIKIYKPLGPTVNSPWSMTFGGEKLFVVPGGRWHVQYQTPGNIMIFENEKWRNISGDSIKQKTNYNVLDLMNVAVDSSDNKHFFVTSYGTGLYEFKDDVFFKWHNHTNSTLTTIIPDAPFNYIRLDGGIFDSEGNFLVTNSNAANGIKILSKTGEWKQLKHPNANHATLGSILISNQNKNIKWVNSVRYTPGLLIYDDNGTPTDNSDDVNSKFMSSFNDTDNEGAKIAPNYVYCLAQDHNGVIWAGTDQGPLLFYNTSKVFETDYTCSRVKIPRNDGTGLADYLLQSDIVKSIAIDGANRKWLGTETSGIYLMSENGQETIKHFTTSNSPLISNDILSIAINPKTGEVFFGTASGLVSYQSDAADSNNAFGNVRAYPNPVRENFNGIITITGLIKDTQIKITDLNGNLICQTTSNGAIATWDGKNSNGKKVSTGIYLVLCVNEDGTQSTATKIMIIN